MKSVTESPIPVETSRPKIYTKLAIVSRPMEGEEGEYHLHFIGRRLKKVLTEEGSGAYILSSSEPGAARSASALAKMLGSRVEETNVLKQKMFSEEDYRPVADLIDENRYEAGMLILVAHIDHALYLPYYFGQDRLNGRLFELPDQIKMGHSVLIDCISQEMQPLSNM